MSSFNTNCLERHRLMFKSKRLTHSQRISKIIKESTSENCNSETNSEQNKSSDNSDNCFSDVISFCNYEFVYDKQFLNNLKQLTKELRSVFSTQESKDKSRLFGQNVAEVLGKERLLLIQSIKDMIKRLEQTPDDTQSSKMSVTQTNTQEMCSQNSQLLSEFESELKTESNRESEEGIQTTQNRFSSERRGVSLNCSSTHTQHWFESLPLDSSDQQIYPFNNWSLEDSYDSGYRLGLDLGLGSAHDFSSQNSSQIYSEMSSQMFSQNGLESVESREQQIQIVNRHKWDNTKYNIATGIVLKADPQNKVRVHGKRRKQLKFILNKILDLLEEDVFCTKRDLYYQNVVMFDHSQRVVDEIIDDLASSFKVSRTKLGIVSSTRGLVFGHLNFFNTNGVLTDCLSSPNGINIPNDTERITRMQSKAIFVLIIEKDATFQQLIDLRIDRKFPLIMITGHGYPDMNTRAFVQMLWNTFEIPIFGLVDGDAHGLEILCTFRHGSLALSYVSNNLVTPVVKWIGVLPTDIIDYKLSPSVQIDLKEIDKKKIKDLKNRIYLKENNEWTKQLDILLKIGKKVEIQSLAEHWPTFLLDVYLPAKIRYGNWI